MIIDSPYWVRHDGEFALSKSNRLHAALQHPTAASRQPVEKAAPASWWLLTASAIVFCRWRRHQRPRYLAQRA